MQKLTPRFMRELYNHSIPKRYHYAYEVRRWLLSRRMWETFRMTYLALEHHLSDIAYESCLELGPGAGTWTKLLLARNPSAKLTLMDISEQMIGQLRFNLGHRDNVEIINKDFTQSEPQQKYDLFFSIRVLEYLGDIDNVLEKVSGNLKEGGNALIVTKMPHPIRSSLWHLGRKQPIQHTEQVSPNTIYRLAKSKGFRNVQLYPVTISLPLRIQPFWLNWLIWKASYKNLLKRWVFPLCESYMIRFEV